jgi:hypothetical protein
VAAERNALAERARELLSEMTVLLASGWLGWLGQADPAIAEEQGEGGSAGGEPMAVELTLTESLASEEEWANGEAAFPRLKGASLFDAETRLRSVLQRRASKGVDVDVAAPSGLDGFLRVQLSCRPEQGVGMGMAWEGMHTKWEEYDEKYLK